VTSSLAVFEAETLVKSMLLIKSYLKTRKKRENLEIKDILHKSPSIRSFRHKTRILTLPRRADAKGSADVMYRIWRISLCGSGIVIEVRK